MFKIYTEKGWVISTQFFVVLPEFQTTHLSVCLQSFQGLI